MIKLLLVIVSTGGMLALGWFVWRGLQAQEASSAHDQADDKVDHKPDTPDTPDTFDDASASG